MLHKRHAIVLRNSKFEIVTRAESVLATPAPNLLLAAGASVGHIGHDGAVAEWLKAAVC
jgi:hypothetical protein